jgi:divalent metal cation (Fe/Co/Zn/Cd) transporter
VTVQESSLVQKIIETTNKIAGKSCCHDIIIRRQGDWLAVSMHCTLDADLSVAQVHDITTLIESRLQEDIPCLERVSVHAEPQGK